MATHRALSSRLDDYRALSGSLGAYAHTPPYPDVTGQGAPFEVHNVATFTLDANSTAEVDLTASLRRSVWVDMQSTFVLYAPAVAVLSVRDRRQGAGTQYVELSYNVSGGFGVVLNPPLILQIPLLFTDFRIENTSAAPINWAYYVKQDGA